MIELPQRIAARHRMFSRSNYAGLYMPNQFLITMSATHPFFARTTSGNIFEPNNAQFPVYAHEHWHFLQNVTTLSGFKSFAFSQHLLPYFSKSAIVNADGTVAGASALTGAEQENLSVLIEAHQSMKGDAGPSVAEDDYEVDFRVVRAHGAQRTLIFRNQSLPLPEIELEVELFYVNGKPSQRHSFLLGSAAIEESVAFTVEEAIAHHASQPVDPVPVFPYRVVERLVEAEVGSADLPAVRAALGTLALMTTHPGPALIDILHTYGQAIRAGRPKSEALDIVARDIKASFRAPVGLVLANDIDELVKMHQGRGLMDGAVRWVATMFRRSLSRRLRDPLFDLGVVFPRYHMAGFRGLLRDYSCDAIQERPDAKKESEELTHEDLFMRDDLVTLTHEQVTAGYRASDYVRALQAQQHYLAEHIDWSGRTLTPSGAAGQACPYYTSCNLDMRKTNPDICCFMPWAHYGDNDRLCWYGSAVAATLGTVRQHKVGP